jgi:hypothetical protein
VTGLSALLIVRWPTHVIDARVDGRAAAKHDHVRIGSCPLR